MVGDYIVGEDSELAEQKGARRVSAKEKRLPKKTGAESLVELLYSEENKATRPQIDVVLNEEDCRGQSLLSILNQCFNRVQAVVADLARFLP